MQLIETIGIYMLSSFSLGILVCMFFQDEKMKKTEEENKKLKREIERLEKRNLPFNINKKYDV